MTAMRPTPAPVAVAPLRPVPLGAGGVVLRHRDASRVLVRGPATGRTYVFSPDQPTRPVDARDVDALMRTGRFARI
jgi:hypothetical protein